LINEEVVMDRPEDISYVFSGLAPLSVRVIEFLLGEKGIKNIQGRKYLSILNILFRFENFEYPFHCTSSKRICTF